MIFKTINYILIMHNLNYNLDIKSLIYHQNFLSILKKNYKDLLKSLMRKNQKNLFKKFCLEINLKNNFF